MGPDKEKTKELGSRVTVVTTWAQEGEMGPKRARQRGMSQSRASRGRAGRNSSARPPTPRGALRLRTLRLATRTHSLLLREGVNSKASQTPGLPGDDARMRRGGRG